MAAKRFEIIWTDFAVNKLQQVFDYYLEEAGLAVANKITSGILTKIDILIELPFAGEEETYLSSFPHGFRRLLYKHYKIIYWRKTDETIEIVNIFDTRQNPKKIKRMK